MKLIRIPKKYPKTIALPPTVCTTQCTLNEFAKPDRIAKTPIERRKKPVERTKPWMDTMPRGLWV